MRASFLCWLSPCLIALLVAACSSEPSPDPGAGAAGTTSSGAGGSGDGNAGGAGGSNAGGAGGGNEGGAGGGVQGPTGSIIAGIAREGTLVMSEMRVTMRVDGAVVHEEVQGGGPSGEVTLPQELAFADLPDGAAVELELQLHHPKYSDVEVRLARSTIIAGKTLLLRITLESSCMIWDDFAEAPDCVDPQTCHFGRCRDAYVPPALLEDYSPSWASYSYCEPEVPGPPVVVLGAGEETFAPLNDLDVMELDAGDQGGHHVWTAIRMRNLKQGSFLQLRAHVPELGLDIGPYTSFRHFGDDPSVGYCEVVGQFFQVDTSVDVSTLIGKSMELTAQVSDAEGDTAEDTRTVILQDAVQP